MRTCRSSGRVIRAVAVVLIAVLPLFARATYADLPNGAGEGPSPAAEPQKKTADRPDLPDFARRLGLDAQGRLPAVDPASFEGRMRASLLTFYGRLDLARRIAPRRHRRCWEKPQDGGGGGGMPPHRLASARDWLIEAARDRRIVMFNEDHDRIEDRLTVAAWLVDLRRLGFTHLGLEAFHPAPGEPDPAPDEAARAYRPQDGFYTVEPAFQVLVRTARDLGFRVFGYEMRPEEGDPSRDRLARLARRETVQAAHIAAWIERAGPRARFVVFAGWAHVMERPDRFGRNGPYVRWMADRLASRTGIDPLTIDTTSCRTTRARFDPRDGAVIALAPDSDAPLVVGAFAGHVDAQILLPLPPEGVDERAFYWAPFGPGRTPPIPFAAMTRPLLIEAYSVRPPLDHPIERFLLLAGETVEPRFHLPLSLAAPARLHPAAVRWRAIPFPKPPPSADAPR